MKKILAIVLSVLMIFTLVCTSTFASENQATIKLKISNKADLVKTREVNYDSTKEDIAMILVIGQSNSTYGVGYEDELKDVASGIVSKVSEVTATPEKGTVFSSITKKPITELTDENDVSTLIDSISFGGYSAALGKTWYEKTGQKVVLVQASVGSTCMHRWLPTTEQVGYTCTCEKYDETHYQDAVDAFTESYNALKDKYNIVHTGYIWNQGENDENRSRYDVTSLDTTQEYYEAYKTMHNSFMSELPLDFGSIAVVRSHYKATSMHFTLAREAQYKLCNDLDNLCMASRIFETCTDDDMHMTTAGGNGIHALQKTYNRVGTDSANNVLEFIGELEAPKFTTVSVFNQDGKVETQFNQEGSVIAGDDIFTAAQTVIPFVDSITNKNKVEFVAQDGIVDEYGNILATAFDTYDSVKLECEFDENVEMDSELATGTTAPVIYKYSLYPSDSQFTISSTFSKYTSSSSNGGDYFYVDGATAGQYATFTSKNSVPAGKYQVKLYMRTLDQNNRAIVDVSLNNAPAVSVNSNLPYKVYEEFVLYDAINVDGTFTLKIEATTAGKIYAGYLEFYKVGEYDSSEVVTPSSTEAPSSSSTTTTTTTTTTTKAPSSGSTPVPTPNSLYLRPLEVSNASNWLIGYYEVTTGKYNPKYQNDSRACVRQLVVVDSSDVYTFTITNADKYNLKLVLREYDKDGTFLRTWGTVLTGGTYTTTDSDVKYVSITIYDYANVINLINNKSVSVSMSGKEKIEDYKWNLYTDNFTYNADHTMNDSTTDDPFLNTYYQEEGAFFFSSGNKVGNSATLTSKDLVAPGTYSVRFWARASGSRALFDLTINGVKVATNLNTGGFSGKEYYNVSYDLTEGTITFAEPTKLVLDFVVTNVSSPYTGNLYLNAIELIKIGDAEETSSTTTTTTTTVPSSSEPVVTPTEHSLSFKDLDFDVTTTPASGSAAFNTTQYKDDGVVTALTTSRSLVAGDKIDCTSKISVPAGKYKVVLQYRAYTGRAKLDITMGDSVYKAFTYATSGGIGTRADIFAEYVHSKDGAVNVTFDAVSDGLFFIEELILTKIGDVETDGEITSVLTTQSTAAIRLGEVNGMRFYTAVDETALLELVGDKEYEIGTIIAPKDSVGEYLTVEDNVAKVVYDYAKFGLYEDKYVVGSIANLKSSNSYNAQTGNLARDFIARAYVLVDGVYYYSESTCVRNIAQIADSYIADANSGYDALDAEIKELVDLWAKAND